MIRRLLSWWRTFREVPAALGAGFRLVVTRLDDLAARLARLERPTERPPFVAVLVLAKTEYEKEVALCSSGYMKEGSQSFAIRVEWWPIIEGRIVVFCDFERVRVAGIFNGVDALTLDAPMATIGRCELGRVIRVVCERREVIHT